MHPPKKNARKIHTCPAVFIAAYGDQFYPRVTQTKSISGNTTRQKSVEKHVTKMSNGYEFFANELILMMILRHDDPNHDIKWSI